MTERGLPTSDGAPACPFVAFEDDRDERATSPDHRHRCYAEPNPAPRALAHQEAYCLSSAFPVCPTFQDWARREAAHSRADSAGAGGAAGSMAAEQVQRNPPRNWQAPPPWMSNASGPDDEVDDRWERDDEEVPAAPAAPAPRDEPVYLDDDDPDEDDAEELARARGLSGSYADRVAAGGGAATSGGAAGSAASGAALGSGAVGYGMGGADDGAPEQPATASAATGSREAEAGWGGAPPPEPAVRPRRERDPERMAGFAESRSTPQPQPARRERRRDPHAPEWESGRPMEAYPTLRARRLPELSVPPILVSVIALALAAAVLFALPGLLGFGSPGGAVATPTRGAGASPSPLASLAPTPVPQPTQRTYTVKDGDTLSSIAKRFDVTLDELIAANTETIPDPDKLAIGDVLIIPVAESDEVSGEP